VNRLLFTDIPFGETYGNAEMLFSNIKGKSSISMSVALFKVRYYVIQSIYANSVENLPCPTHGSPANQGDGDGSKRS
jgi:hypothetical protein